MSLLNPGDRIHYGLSLEFRGGWAKLSADIEVQDGETPAEAVRRAEAVVDSLLIAHVAKLEEIIK